MKPSQRRASAAGPAEAPAAAGPRNTNIAGPGESPLAGATTTLVDTPAEIAEQPPYSCKRPGCARIFGVRSNRDAHQANEAAHVRYVEPRDPNQNREYF